MRFAKMPDEPPQSDLGSSSQNEKTEDSAQSMSSEMSSDSSSGSASEDSDEERERKLKMLQEQVKVTLILHVFPTVQITFTCNAGCQKIIVRIFKLHMRSTQ